MSEERDGASALRAGTPRSDGEAGSQRGPRSTPIAKGVRAVREGHGANCSSIGSVIDTLFASAVVGGALFTAVAAALAREKPRIVGPSATPPRDPGPRR